MTTVFVSYAREDALKAKAVAQALEQTGCDVWFDQRLHSGSEYSREIEAALSGASAVLVLWSKNSVDSAWVRDEAAEGRDSGRLVPVLLDDCRPPIGFRQFQTADLSHWSGRGTSKPLEDVIAAVRAKAGAPPAPQTKPAAARTDQSRRAIKWLTVALGIALVAVGGWFLTTRMSNRAPSAPSIALLPFTADSTDPEARKLASAAHDAVAHTLSQGAFAVHMLDSQSQGGSVPADFVISGHFRSDPDKISATVRMEEPKQRFVVFSDQFEIKRPEASILAERIGAQIAAQVSWTAPLVTIARRHPSDPAIVAALLQQVSMLDNDFSTLQEYETARRLARKAPESANAQLGLAFNTAFAITNIPRDERAHAVAEARRASEKAVILAPEFGDVYIPWCLLRSEQRRVQCEDRLRLGMRTDPDAPFVDSFLGKLFNNVGRNSEAASLASLSLAHDQYMPAKIGFMLRMFEATGQTDAAADLYRRAVRWWPANGGIAGERLWGIVQRGDFEAARRFDREIEGQSKPDPVLAAVAERSLAAVRTACPGSVAEGSDGVLCVLALAQFGDLDAAFALADRAYASRHGRSPADEDRIWLANPYPSSVTFLTAPVAAPLRRDPRFVALAKRVGLLEYWRSGRLPDFCRVPRPEPVCTHIGRR
jgi:TolB-like protein